MKLPMPSRAPIPVTGIHRSRARATVIFTETKTGWLSDPIARTLSSRGRFCVRKTPQPLNSKEEMV